MKSLPETVFTDIDIDPEVIKFPELETIEKPVEEEAKHRAFPSELKEFQDIRADDIEKLEDVRAMELMDEIAIEGEGLDQDLYTDQDPDYFDTSFYRNPVDENLKDFLPSYCLDERGYVREFQGIYFITQATTTHPLSNTVYIVYAKPDESNERLMAFTSRDQTAIEAFPDLATQSIGGFTMLEPGQIINTVIVPPTNVTTEPMIIIYAHPDPNLMLMTEEFFPQEELKEAA